MESKKKVLENQLPEEIYSAFQTGKKRLIFVGMVLFFLGIAFNFPLQKTVDSLLVKSLKPPKNCPFTYKDLSFSIFMPKLVFTDLNLPGVCFGARNQGITLKEARLYFRGPSFSPLGISTKIETKIDDQEIEVFAAAGPKIQKIKIPSTTLEGKNLARFLSAVKLAGKIEVEGLFELKNKKLTEGNLLVKSENFSLPAQNIKGFQLDNMNFGSLILKATVGKTGELSVRELKLGNKKAPFNVDLRGRVALILARPALSQVSLNGSLKISKAFMNKMPIINAFIGGLKKDGDKYLIKITGPLATPRIQ